MSSTGEHDDQAWREPNELDLGALHVQFALRTASELPRYLDDSGLPTTVQIACLESLLTNLRLLLEFTVRGQTKRDIHRSQYLPHWQPEHTEELHELERLWPFISGHVSHLGRVRVEVPHPTDMGPSRTPGEWARVVADVRDALRPFAAELERRRHPQAGIFLTALRVADDVASEGPAPASLARRR